MRRRTGLIVFFGGPAGAGKSMLAKAWCATRREAAHLELDEIRGLIVTGLADPQTTGSVQDEQHRLSVGATCALARAFAEGGCDVAVDDVLEPAVFARDWEPRLDGLEWRLVVLLPTLDETLARSARRPKRVREDNTRTQHAKCGEWPPAMRVDTTGLTVAQSLDLVLERLNLGT